MVVVDVSVKNGNLDDVNGVVGYVLYVWGFNVFDFLGDGLCWLGVFVF